MAQISEFIDVKQWLIVTQILLNLTAIEINNYTQLTLIDVINHPCHIHHSIMSVEGARNIVWNLISFLVLHSHIDTQLIKILFLWFLSCWDMPCIQLHLSKVISTTHNLSFVSTTPIVEPCKYGCLVSYPYQQLMIKIYNNTTTFPGSRKTWGLADGLRHNIDSCIANY